MADSTTTKKTPAKSTKGATTKTSGPAKTASRKTGATTRGPDAAPAAPAGHTAEAKSRFNRSAR